MRPCAQATEASFVCEDMSMNIKKITGGLLMGVGVLLVCGALALFLSNQREDAQAGDAAERVLPQVVEHIEETRVEEETEPEAVYGTEMTEVMLDGYAYIGYLSIPTLDLELPVMSEWDYARLKIAPCRYTGSTKSDDLVICAHNYTRHFGTLKNLSVGDAVYFTDMDGMVSSYEVASVEILDPTAVEEMTDSGYALTLFTCTYGGASRVTVRCSRTGGTP